MDNISTRMGIRRIDHFRCGPHVRCAILALLVGLAAACSPDKILGGKSLPPDVRDPSETKTPAGALAAYRGARMAFNVGFGSSEGGGNSFVLVSGTLADELGSSTIGLVGTTSPLTVIDSRALPEYSDAALDQASRSSKVYDNLQKTRGQAREARGALARYAPDTPPALRGELLALEAYSDIFLADLFCSGIPLSTLDFEGDYTYQAGSTTREAYARAVGLFDSALTLAADSDRILNLARVGKGRALLALGDYGAAAQAVAGVADGYRYQIDYTMAAGSRYDDHNFVYQLAATMVDSEGVNGLDYISSQDPRTRANPKGKNTYGMPLFVPAKYAAGDSPVVLADWVEARLIQAEAALQANDTDPSWLATLNVLRTDGTYDTQPNVQDSTQSDTLWHMGAGGVAGLRPLEDPGDFEARVDLLFRERAFWLFLTGHRQGDMRRLIREYGRAAEAVYPTGRYLGAGGAYGSDVTAPIPASERAYNPKFKGCINRGA